MVRAEGDGSSTTTGLATADELAAMGAGGTLDGGEVVPGFRLALGGVFG